MAAPDWNEYLAQKAGNLGFSEFPQTALAEAQAEYLNTYGNEGIANLRAAGVELPQTFVDPSAEAGYRGFFDEHVAAGKYKPEEWDTFKAYFMGDENTPAQGGTWSGVDGVLRFQPNSAQGSYRDTGNWLTNFSSAIPGALDKAFNPASTYEALRTSRGVFDAVDALFDPMSGQMINAGLGLVGSAIKDDPNLQSAVGVLGPSVGGVVGSVIPGAGTAVGAAVGKGVSGKILGEDNQSNFLGALQTYVTATALSGLADTAQSGMQGLGDYVGGAGVDGMPLVPIEGVTPIAFDMEPYGILGDAPFTGSEIALGTDAGLAAGSIAGPPAASTWDTIKGAIPSVSKVLDTAGTVASVLTGGAQEEFPALPALLEPLGAGDDLPPLPERVALAIPEGMTYPDVAPYFPKNWDSMSDAEKESWMITRGGELAKRRRGTWAGNLGGIRGGAENLEYAELTGMGGGKQILGA